MKSKEEKAQLNIVRIESGENVNYKYDFSGDYEILLKGIGAFLLYIEQEEKKKNA